MTEILVESLDVPGAVVQPELQAVGPIPLQGFAAAGSPGATTRVSRGGSQYSIQTAEREREREKRERANSRASVPTTTSLKSEPDLDTIMPLPGSAYYKHRGQSGYHHLQGEGSDTDSEGSGTDRSPYAGHTIASFTTVEVGLSCTGA